MMLMRVSQDPTNVPATADSVAVDGRSRSFVPHAAREAGLVGRYRYWQGRSGKRFLFTRVGKPAPGEYVGAVLLATLDGEVIWVGDTADQATVGALDVLPDDAVWFLHLLASTRSRRQEIVGDLLPTPQLSLGFIADDHEAARALPQAA